ncbi:phosphotransferase family protein [Streptomyces bambusae]|uniref:phosphotransferase family protein n=1 Tax=Streptomyces bambusae TaxID=1550616 RepID=UPI0035561047
MPSSRLPVRAVAAAGLGRAGPVRVLESSPRSRVWRVETDGGAVVVKRSVGGADAAERFVREVSALRVAARAEHGPGGASGLRPGPRASNADGAGIAPGVPVAPRLIWDDADERVLVLEWVEHRPAEDGWQVGYATALARLHATAVPGDAGALPRQEGPGERDVEAFLALADALGADVPAGAAGELSALVGRLAGQPGNALLHGDPCPGNDLHTAGGIRFVDFEQACLGSGVTELAYLRIGFPTCWCSTGPAAELLTRAEAAYADTWRAETGTEATGSLADACAGWLIRGDALVPRDRRDGTDHLARMRRRDWTWGTATARGRLAHRLGVVAALCTDHEGLHAVGELAASLRARMRARWPEVRPLPGRRPAGW